MHLFIGRVDNLVALHFLAHVEATFCAWGILWFTWQLRGPWTAQKCRVNSLDRA